MIQEHSKAAFDAYQSSAGGTAGVARTIMLYDQVTARLAEARTKWEGGILDGAFAAMQQAAAVLVALSATLDDDRGGRVSETLRRYYNGLAFQVLALPRQRDPLARIDSLMRQVRVVREAWTQVLDQESEKQRSEARIRQDVVGASLA